MSRPPRMIVSPEVVRWCRVYWCRTHWLRRLPKYVIACVLLAITLPLLLIVACAIRWEGPAVLERQERIGCSGRRFQMLKFRTTVYDAEHARQPGLRR